MTPSGFSVALIGPNYEGLDTAPDVTSGDSTQLVRPACCLSLIYNEPCYMSNKY